jgi:hypothetical protein
VAVSVVGITSDPDPRGEAAWPAPPTKTSAAHPLSNAEAPTAAPVSWPHQWELPEPVTKLEDVLPEIKDLALRVGGLRKLADIVTSMARGQG